MVFAYGLQHETKKIEKLDGLNCRTLFKMSYINNVIFRVKFTNMYPNMHIGHIK